MPAGQASHGKGIIPALAGNTPSQAETMESTTDHPRSRGEYGAIEAYQTAVEGSSPLSRGIPDPLPTWPSPKGIIPALAGNTICLTSSRCSTTDHPRSRGEYSGIMDPEELPQGSSPLSRGIPGTGTWRSSSRGIIPALAGNTRPQPPPTCSCRDHPRSRGEYVPPRIGCCWQGGSSPLSRGIR